MLPKKEILIDRQLRNDLREKLSKINVPVYFTFGYPFDVDLKWLEEKYPIDLLRYFANCAYDVLRYYDLVRTPFESMSDDGAYRIVFNGSMLPYRYYYAVSYYKTVIKLVRNFTMPYTRKDYVTTKFRQIRINDTRSVEIEFDANGLVKLFK